jgi:hypothetical protein
LDADGQVRTPDSPLKILPASIVVISTVDDEPFEGRAFKLLYVEVIDPHIE